MPNHSKIVEHSEVPLSPPTRLSHISWGSILAGVAVALSLQLLLNLLGIGIGASTINPGQGDTPGSGLAIGAGIWFALSALISLFCGGWAAGRLSGDPDSRDGMLHGFTTWSLTTILTLAMLTSAVGGLIGGSASLLGKAASVSGQGAAAAAPMLSNLASQATGVTPDDLKQQAGEIASDPRFQSFVTDILRNGQVSPESRNNLVQLVAQKQNIPQQQADAEVTGWQQRLEQAKGQAGAKATEVADKAASGVAKTALWSFFALLLGAVAATLGGRFGSQRFRMQPRMTERTAL